MSATACYFLRTETDVLEAEILDQQIEGDGAFWATLDSFTPAAERTESRKGEQQPIIPATTSLMRNE